jgi:hypothetical protein
MGPIRCRLALVCLAAVACAVGQAYPARADDTEYRDYVIFVDGKEAGQSRITMVEKADGSTYVSATAKVRVKVVGLFTGYSYDVTAQEQWQAGRLVSLKSVATEDSKTTRVDVTRTGEQLRVQINGSGGNFLRPDVWPSSYWKLADKRFHNKQVPILDADTGNELTGQLTYVNLEKLKIGGKLDDCYHFRVTGIPVPIDLWFDRYHRLVRQEFTESGHRTIVQVIAVRR